MHVAVMVALYMHSLLFFFPHKGSLVLIKVKTSYLLLGCRKEAVLLIFVLPNNSSEHYEVCDEYKNPASIQTLDTLRQHCK